MVTYNRIEGASALPGFSTIFSTQYVNVYEIIAGITYNVGSFDVNSIAAGKQISSYRVDLSNRLKRHQISRVGHNLKVNTGYIFADQLLHQNFFPYQNQTFTDSIPTGVTFNQSQLSNLFKLGEITMLPGASGNAFMVDRVTKMKNGHVLMLIRTSAYSTGDGNYVQFRFRHDGETNSNQRLTFARDAGNVRRIKLESANNAGSTVLGQYTDASSGGQFSSTANHWIDLWLDEGRIVVSSGSFAAGTTPYEMKGLSRLIDVFADQYFEGMMDFRVPSGDSTSVMAFMFQSMEEPMIAVDSLRRSVALAGMDVPIATGVTLKYNETGFTWTTAGFTATSNGDINYFPVDTGLSFSRVSLGYSVANYDGSNLRFNKRGGFAVDFNFIGNSGNVIGIGVSPYYSWVTIGGVSPTGVIQYTGATYYLRQSAGMVNTVETLSNNRMRMYVTTEGSIFWYLNGRAWDMAIGYSLQSYLFSVEESNKRPIELIFKGINPSFTTLAYNIVAYPDIRMSDSDIMISAGSPLSSLSEEQTGDGYIVGYGYSSVNLVDLLDVSNPFFRGLTYSDSLKHIQSIEGSFDRNVQRLTIGNDPYNSRMIWMGYSKSDRIFLEPMAGIASASTLNVSQNAIDPATINRAEQQLENEGYVIQLRTIDPRIEIGDRLRLVSNKSEFDLNLGKEVVVTSFSKDFTAESGDVAMTINVAAITIGVTINNTINI